MRILFITQWFDPEPSPISGMNLVRFLRDKGHEIHVVTTFPNYPGGRFTRATRTALEGRTGRAGYNRHPNGGNPEP
ncbi:MAG: hypothetical protein R2706_07360 [Acidimicrobiales bacterium]